MPEPQWPSPTPRDEMLARVVARGRRIRMIRNTLVGVAVGVAAAAGATGLALGVSGVVDFGGSSAGAQAPAAVGATLSYYLCPGSGAAGELNTGDRVYLTGRDESGDWVQLRSPQGQDQAVWVRAAAVDPDRQVDLPLAECGIEVGEFESADGGTTTTTTEAPAAETEEPEGPDTDESTTTTSSTTTTTSSPSTTSTTQPTPTSSSTTTSSTTTTTSTTTPPDNQGPSISNLGRTAPVIRTATGEFCDLSLPLSTQVSARVTDPSGIQVVEARWSFSFAGSQRTGSVAMTHSGGGNYTGTIDLSHLSGAQTTVDINWSVRARDGAGNTSTAVPSPNARVELQGC